MKSTITKQSVPKSLHATYVTIPTTSLNPLTIILTKNLPCKHPYGNKIIQNSLCNNCGLQLTNTHGLIKRKQYHCHLNLLENNMSARRKHKREQNKFTTGAISYIEETYVERNAHYNPQAETWACKIRNRNTANTKNPISLAISLITIEQRK